MFGIGKQIDKQAVFLLGKLSNRLYIGKVFAVETCATDDLVTTKLYACNWCYQNGNSALATCKVDVLLEVPLERAVAVSVVFGAVLGNGLKCCGLLACRCFVKVLLWEIGCCNLLTGSCWVDAVCIGRAKRSHSVVHCGVGRCLFGVVIVVTKLNKQVVARLDFVTDGVATVLRETE